MSHGTHDDVAMIVGKHPVKTRNCPARYGTSLITMGILWSTVSFSCLHPLWIPTIFPLYVHYGWYYMVVYPPHHILMIGASITIKSLFHDVKSMYYSIPRYSHCIFIFAWSYSQHLPIIFQSHSHHIPITQ